MNFSFTLKKVNFPSTDRSRTFAMAVYFLFSTRLQSYLNSPFWTGHIFGNAAGSVLQKTLTPTCRLSQPANLQLPASWLLLYPDTHRLHGHYSRVKVNISRPYSSRREKTPKQSAQGQSYENMRRVMARASHAVHARHAQYISNIITAALSRTTPMTSVMPKFVRLFGNIRDVASINKAWRAAMPWKKFEGGRHALRPTKAKRHAFFQAFVGELRKRKGSTRVTRRSHFASQL